LYWGQDAHGSYDKNDANGQKDLLTYCSGEWEFVKVLTGLRWQLADSNVDVRQPFLWLN
jgi:hypothetical protein